MPAPRLRAKAIVAVAALALATLVSGAGSLAMVSGAELETRVDEAKSAVESLARQELRFRLLTGPDRDLASLDRGAVDIERAVAAALSLENAGPVSAELDVIMEAVSRFKADYSEIVGLDERAIALETEFRHRFLSLADGVARARTVAPAFAEERFAETARSLPLLAGLLYGTVVENAGASFRAALDAMVDYGTRLEKDGGTSEAKLSGFRVHSRARRALETLDDLYALGESRRYYSDRMNTTSSRMIASVSTAVDAIRRFGRTRRMAWGIAFVASLALALGAAVVLALALLPAIAGSGAGPSAETVDGAKDGNPGGDADRDRVDDGSGLDRRSTADGE